MKEKLRAYVEKFNNEDVEYYRQDIDNEHSLEWMAENIPLFECPQKTLEEIYYFRWWVYRKHIKSTDDGYIITEFLPPVSWAGKHNSIIAAAGHHVSEGKWLKNGHKYLKDYIKFWLEEKSKTYLYSSWLCCSIYELSKQLNDFSFAIENLPLIINYYETMAKEHETNCGLFWSIDGNDAMECSISGTKGQWHAQKGIRPTLNSYMAANAFAISKIAEKAGKHQIAKEYAEKYEVIKSKITEFLWDGEFYKAIHGEDIDNLPSVNEIAPDRDAKELIGYIPWSFCLAPNGFEKAFSELKNPECFKGKYGLFTADKRHPRFMYQNGHECLWNGYVWPFATTQTLDAVNRLLECYEQDFITKDDFYEMLITYAGSHYRTLPDGKKLCWIDEVRHPLKDEWSSRAILKVGGWTKEKGGIERGKDYNHSAFCNIVLGGLLGIKIEDGKIAVNPKIPDSWDYFAVENLWIAGKSYNIYYDKYGTRYGKGKGIRVIH